MKLTVHNKMEADALMKEACDRGDAEKYDGAEFWGHDGQPIYRTTVTWSFVFHAYVVSKKPLEAK